MRPDFGFFSKIFLAKLNRVFLLFLIPGCTAIVYTSKRNRNVSACVKRNYYFQVRGKQRV